MPTPSIVPTRCFETFSDDALLARFQADDLTSAERLHALEELQRRAVMPARIEPLATSLAVADAWVVLERFFSATDAFIMQGCLMAAGVQAQLADANLVQTYGLLTPALGGVRLLVAPGDLSRAQAVVAAWRRGDYALSEDADVGSLDS